MSKLASLFTDRFKKKEKNQENSSTAVLPEKTEERGVALFADLFGVKKLDQQDQNELSDLLQKYKQDESFDASDDLRSLVAITTEVKAISNQAAILHGERIKTAQEILKKYREGAFTAWLKATYGNRQTPYNFLQYYLFHTKMPPELHSKVEAMPRQAIYTLASREGELEKKQEIVRSYSGETKLELLTQIRTLFPLDEKDGRRENVGESAWTQLKRISNSFERNDLKLSLEQKRNILQQLKTLENLVKNTETL